VRYQGGNRPYLSFTTEEVYPATRTLNFISGNLEQAGWKKLDYDLLNPQRKSSHLIGWYDPLRRWFGSGGDSEETTSRNRRFQWEADWINDKNDTINVRLRYAPPDGNDGKFTTLDCHLSQTPPDPLQLHFIERYRQVHESK
jgi:hypothetical protein